MKILIVDDEPLVRIGIKSAIPWDLNGMEIVGEAADGEEAIRLMMERKPDVVILDIKMPKKDGIEVLTDMKSQGIEAKCIILSSFDDFVYVKKAMKLGAVDYFHKPSMNVSDILDILKKVQQELQPAQEKPIDRGFSKKADLQNMLHGKIADANRTKLKEGNLHLALFSIKKYAHVLKRYTNDNVTLLPNTIINILSELLDKEKEVEFTQMDKNLYAIAISNSGCKSEQASLTYVNEVIQLISVSLKRFVNIDIIFGVSQACRNFAELKAAYDQARQALAQKFYHPETSVFYYHHHYNLDEQTLEQATDFIKAMKSGLKDENREQFTNNLEAWEQYLREKECMNEQDVRKIYDFILFMLDNGEGYAEYRVKSDEIEDFNTLMDLCHPIFEEKLSAGFLSCHHQYSPIIRNVVQYLESHYTQEISLKKLGEQFHVSANYLSRLFNQEVGRGLSDCLNEIRIDKAKDLLKDYRYKIYEIAEMVGFNSNVHFAIVFNKYVGMSPKEYRKENS